ncbi:hypothetical protein [Streptomyces sp. NPDC057429]
METIAAATISATITALGGVLVAWIQQRRRPKDGDEGGTGPASKVG